MFHVEQFSIAKLSLVLLKLTTAGGKAVGLMLSVLYNDTVF